MNTENDKVKKVRQTGGGEKGKELLMLLAVLLPGYFVYLAFNLALTGQLQTGPASLAGGFIGFSAASYILSFLPKKTVFRRKIGIKYNIFSWVIGVVLYLCLYFFIGKG